MQYVYPERVINVCRGGKRMKKEKEDPGEL